MLRQISNPIRSIFKMKSRLLFGVQLAGGFSSKAELPTKQDMDKLIVLYTHSSYHDCKPKNNKFMPIFALLILMYNTLTGWNIYNTLLFGGALAGLAHYLVFSKKIIYCIQCDRLLQNLYVTVPMSLYSFQLQKQYGAGITPQQKKDLIDNYHPTHRMDGKLKQINFSKLQRKVLRLKFPTKDVRIKPYLVDPKNKQTKTKETQKFQINNQPFLYLNIDYLSRKNPKIKGSAMMPFKIYLTSGLHNPYQKVLEFLVDGQIQLALTELQKVRVNELQSSKQSEQAQKKDNQ